MNGLFQGKGAKGLKQFEGLPKLSRFKENRYRKELFLVNDEEIITLEVVDLDVHVKTTLGDIVLTEDGRLIEDGICYEDDNASNSKLA
jgi:hypothetical protein